MRKRILTLGIVGTALIVGGVAYHFGFFSRPRPNVILIVLDTFRADRLAAHGNTRGLTPVLDQWAAKSTVYERAYAASPWTAPSVATLLLAQYPSEHQVIRMTSLLPYSGRTLAEVLRDNGFRTGGFSGNVQISPQTGFAQGFDTFELLQSLGTPNGDAQQLNQAALRWLAQPDEAHRPFLGNLQQRGLLRRTLVIITADHGEQFGEHGLFSHGVSLYESAIHVPLIVRFPNQTRAERFTLPVELAGLGPALLGQLGIPQPTEFHIRAMALGESASRTKAASPIFSEVLKTQPQDFRLHRYALIDGTRKMLVTEAGDYLYGDLATDPQENHELTAPPFAEQLRQNLTRVTSMLSAPSHPHREATIDDQTRERLHSLGYAN